ncbi:hypothetical protein MKQ70_27585 [Chitinophaga sedimenti]|uniref:hypothetical protein n=1 Tax=Chitinophaga sedimenti TaxID=2033606 RepID=UPI00200503B4|nr:hypothetical protein [Chitinophaga sedimenti]MCK7558554.1 hypothetical protein [Chitinophaga sedimenti]
MKRIATFLFACICLTAAAPAKDDLYTTEQEWKVTINDGWFSAKTVTMGNFSTSSRKNGIAAGSPSAQFKNTQNASNFTVKGEDENMLVQVLRTPIITFSEQKLPKYLSELKGEATLFYAWINGTKAQPLQTWELLLKDPSYLNLNDNASIGILRSGKEELRITAHNKFGIVNSHEKPCFEFHDGKKTLAAVMVAEQPRMWVSVKVEEGQKKILVAAMSALLMRI